LCLNSAIFD